MGKSNISDVTKNMGERWLVSQLIEYKNWEVEYVNYVGADLLALDRKTNARYAISVKTRRHKTDSDSCSLFKDKDATKLREFAATVSRIDNVVIPVVAYVIVKRDGSICAFIINLDDLDDMRDDPNNKIVDKKLVRKKGTLDAHDLRDYLFKYAQEQIHLIEKEKRICYISYQGISNSMKNVLYREWNKEEFCLNDTFYANQQGAFGEHYILWLARFYGVHSFLVQSEGVDIISVDSNDSEKQYGVSVKTFTKKPSKKKREVLYTFEKSNVEKLQSFCSSERWNMIPVIAINFVIVGKDNMPCKLVSLNMCLEYALWAMRNQEIPHIQIAKNNKGEEIGMKFVVNVDRLDELKNNTNISVKIVEFS